MTIRKAISTVTATTLIFAVVGTLIGWLLGRYVPNYYRGVFFNGDSPEFDPLQMGIGLGLTQGLTGGSVVGLLITWILTWQHVRMVGRAQPDPVGDKSN